MRYLARRLGLFVLTLWAAVTINFVLPRMMPGDPAEIVLSKMRGQVNPQTIAALKAAFGVDNPAPMPQQYLEYLGNMLTGRLGISITFFPDPVEHVLLLAIPWTLGLIGLTTIISFVLGTLAGMVAGWRHGGALDSVLPPLFILLGAFPYFWVALLALYVLGIVLGWFPIGFGYQPGTALTLTPGFVGQVVGHAILPALTIVVTSVGGWILTMRNNMLTTLTEDYVRMARAKGLSPWRIMLQYAGRNAVLPSLTGFAMSLGLVISGALLVEYVFSYPGVGFVLLQAVQNEDYPLMQALFLLITVAVLIAVLGSDLLIAWLDPRTRERR